MPDEEKEQMPDQIAVCCPKHINTLARDHHCASAGGKKNPS